MNKYNVNEIRKEIARCRNILHDLQSALNNNYNLSNLSKDDVKILIDYYIKRFDDLNRTVDKASATDNVTYSNIKFEAVYSDQTGQEKVQSYAYVIARKGKQSNEYMVNTKCWDSNITAAQFYKSYEDANRCIIHRMPGESVYIKKVVFKVI